MPIRVLIVDDHQVVRHGLRMLLHGSDIEVCAEVESPGEILAAVARSSPDVILLDIRLDGQNALSVLPMLGERFPNTKVLVFTSQENPHLEAQAYRDGASGFLLKSIAKDELVGAIRTAAGGKSLWTRTDQRRLNSFLRQTPGEVADQPPLTNREREILLSLVEGLTNKTIGQKLGISAETVKEHIQHLFRKLGVSDRTQAAVWAVRNGLC